jgi:transposase
MRYRDEIQLTPYLRDRMIIKLRQRGLSYRAIGKRVGMDASGVYRAWQRLQAGGQGTRPRD